MEKKELVLLLAAPLLEKVNAQKREDLNASIDAFCDANNSLSDKDFYRNFNEEFPAFKLYFDVLRDKNIIEAAEKLTDFKVGKRDSQIMEAARNISTIKTIMVIYLVMSIIAALWLFSILTQGY